MNMLKPSYAHGTFFLDNRLVGENTRQLMASRREWTIQRLHRHYQLNGCPADASVRLGEVLLLLPELEVILIVLFKIVPLSGDLRFAL